MDLKQKVKKVSDILEKIFGAPEREDTNPLDCLIRTILSQNTNDVNRDRAYDILREDFPTWKDVMNTDVRKIAEAISERIGRPVSVGRYVDMVDSLHIYGAYFHDIEDSSREGVKGFFEMIDIRPFEERTWTSDFVKPFFIDDGLSKGLRRMLEREKEMPAETRRKIEKELAEMEKDTYIV